MKATGNQQYGAKLHAETRRRVEHLVVFLESLGGSRALALAIALRYGEPLAVMNLPFKPDDYLDPVSFFRAYQAHRLLAKCDFLDFGVDTRAAALDAFDKYERLCSATNRRLRTRPLMGRAGRIFRLARQMILNLLGDCPMAFSEELERAEWGGGSTSSCKGQWTSRYNKIGSSADLTQGLSWCTDWLKDQPWTPIGEVKLVLGNTIGTVPKSFKTDRTIAVEPTVNAAMQRAMGKLLGRLLLKWGVNTSDQSKNQRWARKGSETGLYATIDLEGASDCISQALVEAIMPPAWVAYLNGLRSPFYRKMNGEWWLYHKHSSMGNGYTFELESLIFASVARAATALYGDGNVFCVYGDDIIVETRVDPYVRGTLKVLGFRTNHQKSFRRGPFRESCGGDYFNGQMVTPYYARNWDSPEYAYTLANYLADYRGYLFDTPGRLWKRTISLIPKAHRLFGLSPAAGCFHVNPWNEKFVGSTRSFRTLAFRSHERPLEGPAGVIEMALRVETAGRLPGLPRLCLTEVGVTDTARRSGAWVLRTTRLSEWFVVEDY